MNKQFKLGLAKTRCGYEASINEEFEGKLYGRVQFGSGWHSCSWSVKGLFQEGITNGWDLMPNVEPVKVIFLCEWYKHDDIYRLTQNDARLQLLDLLEGKRTRVEVTVLDDNEGSKRGRK